MTIQLAVRSSVAAALLLLLETGTASAECAWALWVERNVNLLTL